MVAVSNRRYTCILFDVDNTLIDTDQLKREALAQCGAEGVRHVAPELLRTTSPSKLLKSLGCPAPAQEYWKYYQMLITERAEPIDPATSEVLLKLESRGVKLGIVSSARRREVELMLDRCEIADRFSSCRVTYRRDEPRKPSPDPILRALTSLDHDAAGTMYIGDARGDAEASMRAGVDYGIPGWADIGENVVRELKAEFQCVFLDNMAALLRYAASI